MKGLHGFKSSGVGVRDLYLRMFGSDSQGLRGKDLEFTIRILSAGFRVRDSGFRV